MSMEQEIRIRDLERGMLLLSEELRKLADKIKENEQKPLTLRRADAKTN